jgi:hypothetical protein
VREREREEEEKKKKWREAGEEHGSDHLTSPSLFLDPY